MTLILGIAIFYTFNAIESQTVLLNVSKSTREIINFILDMLSGISVFVAFVLGFLMIYANRFLMKRRSKEFGLYLLLGMGKRSISVLLFLETLFIGMISLVFGFIIGFFASQVMSIVVANMFEADMTQFTFVFSKYSFVKTLCYFGIMYAILMIFNTVNINKCKLIDLLQSRKQSEQIKLKNPFLCTIVFLLSSCGLGYAYYIVTGGLERWMTVNIFLPIGIGMITTFLIFWSLSGLILFVVKRMNGVYFKGLNSFTFRQISSKINTSVLSMTVICIMLFFTICILSSSISINNSMTKNYKTLLPADIVLSKPKALTTERGEQLGFTREQIANSYLSIEENLQQLNIDLKQYFTDITTVFMYKQMDFTIQKALGNQYETIEKEYSYINFNQINQIMTISDYNRVATLYGKETYTLEENEYLIVADYDGMVTIWNQALQVGENITINNKTYKPKYTTCINGFVELSANHANGGIFIVPDSAVNEHMLYKELLIANYNEDSGLEKKEIDAYLLDTEKIENILLTVNTKLSIYEASIGLGAMVIFLGLYIGIVFLVASAAILALKELSESSDNRERFQMLRNLGADESMIYQALFRQIFIFFFFPLLVAIIHSIFGIIFCNFLLETMGVKQMLQSIVITAGILVAIYGGYFSLTYFCSKSIIGNTKF